VRADNKNPATETSAGALDGLPGNSAYVACALRGYYSTNVNRRKPVFGYGAIRLAILRWQLSFEKWLLSSVYFCGKHKSCHL